MSTSPNPKSQDWLLCAEGTARAAAVPATGLRPVAVLCAMPKSVYGHLPGVEVYDEARDAMPPELVHWLVEVARRIKAMEGAA